MASSDIKPFIFWIVCGAIFVVELAVFFVVTPSVAAGRKTLDSRQVAKAFSDEYAKLVDGYDTRSKNTEALGNRPIQEEINPADQASIDKVLAKYIVGDAWLNEINAERTNYQTIHKDIKVYLYNSSKELEALINGEYHRRDGFEQVWYKTGYNPAVADLLEKAIKAKVVRVGPAEATKEHLSSMAAKGLRERFGFVTTDGNWPPANTHDGLNKRFRITEALLDTLGAATGTVLPDPRLVQKVMVKNAEGEEVEQVVVDVPPPEETDWELTKVAIESIAVAETPVPRSSQAGPACWEVEIKLRGTAGALFGAVRALDAMRAPIVVRLGAQWQYTPPDLSRRKMTNLKDVFFGLTVKVIVCDFAHFKPQD